MPFKNMFFMVMIKNDRHFVFGICISYYHWNSGITYIKFLTFEVATIPSQGASVTDAYLINFNRICDRIKLD
jgi:hypothetical protein